MLRPSTHMPDLPVILPAYSQGGGKAPHEAKSRVRCRLRKFMSGGHRLAGVVLDLQRGAVFGRFIEELARPGVGAHRLAVDVKDHVSSTQAGVRRNCEAQGYNAHEAQS